MSRLPPIEPTDEERETEILLRAIATEHAQRHIKDNPAGLFGGTALKILLEIPRPTTDLDWIKIHPDRNIAKDEIVPIMREMGIRHVKAVSYGNRMSHAIRYGSVWPWRCREFKVDEVIDNDHQWGLPRLRNGIATWEPSVLAAGKVSAVTGRDGRPGRGKARDIYDCGYIAIYYPNLVTMRQLEGLLAALAASPHPRQMQDWIDDFNKDTIMSRVAMDDVLASTIEAVEEEIVRRDHEAQRNQTRTDNSLPTRTPGAIG